MTQAIHEESLVYQKQLKAKAIELQVIRGIIAMQSMGARPVKNKVFYYFLKLMLQACYVNNRKKPKNHLILLSFCDQNHRKHFWYSYPVAYYFFIGAGVRALQSHTTDFSCRSFSEFSHVLRVELQELGITQQWEVMQRARNYHEVLITNLSWRQHPRSGFKDISFLVFFPPAF